MNQPETQKPEELFKQIREMRLLVDTYLEFSNDPILEALFEKETDLVKVVLRWYPLYQLSQAIYEEALKQGDSIETATKKADDKKVEIASRISGAEREAA
jgi:hypothetical protein